MLVVSGFLVAKYVIYFDLLVVASFAGAPAIAAFFFIRKYREMPSRNEALFLTIVCGSSVFYLFASTDIEQMQQPIVGVLYKIVFLMFGSFLGYVVCAIFFFSRRVWSAELSKLNKSSNSDGVNATDS